MENGIYIQHIAKFDSAVSKSTLQIIKKRPLKLTELRTALYPYQLLFGAQTVETPQRMTTDWINLVNALTPFLDPI
jgi:hypothetical protein